MVVSFSSLAKESRVSQTDEKTFLWQKESSEMRSSLGVGQNIRPWTSRHCFKGEGLKLTPRVLECIDLCVIQKCREQNEPLDGDLDKVMAGCYIDVSQSASRRYFTNKDGGNRALTTGSKVYSFSRDSVLVGRELLLLHGQPRSLNLPSDVPESHVVHLAGEGTALPCLAAVLWSLYLVRQFPELPENRHV